MIARPQALNNIGTKMLYMRKILLPVIMLSLGALPLYAPAQGIADLLGKKYAEVKSSLLAAGWARVRTSTHL